MKNNLLKNAIVIALSAGTMTACGVDEGRDYKFSSPNPVVWDADLTGVITPESSIEEASFALYKDATVAGVVLTDQDSVFVTNLSVETELSNPDNPNYNPSFPQGYPTRTGDGVSEAEVLISPFGINPEIGSPMVIDAAMFRESVSACGDKPESAEFTLSYRLDNGYSFGYGDDAEDPSVRKFFLTVNGYFTPGESIETVPSAAEGITMKLADYVVETPFSMTQLPEKSCSNKLVAVIDDESIASFNPTGSAIVAQSVGTTFVTISNPEETDVAPVVISIVVEEAAEFETFTLNIANKDSYNDIDKVFNKEIPTCVPVGIHVDPFPVEAPLSGEYVYSWASSDTVNFPFIDGDVVKNGFGEMAKFIPPTGAAPDPAVEPFTITTSLVSGETGTATPTADAVTNVTVVENNACQEMNRLAPDPVPWNFDFDFEVLKNWRPANGSTNPQITTGGRGLRGEGLEISIVNTAASDNGEYGTMFFHWNGAEADQPGAMFGYNLGRNTQPHEPSIGKTAKVAVWVKLNYDTEPTEDVYLNHHLTAWNFNNGEGQVSGDEPYAGQNRRYWTYNARLQAKLVKTTEWQLAEFKDTKQTDDTEDDTWTFTVPPQWKATTGTQLAIIPDFLITGLVDGNSVILDDYSMVIKTP